MFYEGSCGSYESFIVTIVPMYTYMPATYKFFSALNPIFCQSNKCPLSLILRVFNSLETLCNLREWDHCITITYAILSILCLKMQWNISLLRIPCFYCCVILTSFEHTDFLSQVFFMFFPMLNYQATQIQGPLFIILTPRVFIMAQFFNGGIINRVSFSLNKQIDNSVNKLNKTWARIKMPSRNNSLAMNARRIIRQYM